MHLTRGTLSGNGRFCAYGLILAIDGSEKLVAACIVLFALGVGERGLLRPGSRSHRSSPPGSRCGASTGSSRPGPDAPYSELSRSLGSLLAGSLLMQTLGYAALLAVGS